MTTKIPPHLLEVIKNVPPLSEEEKRNFASTFETTVMDIPNFLREEEFDVWLSWKMDETFLGQAEADIYTIAVMAGMYQSLRRRPREQIKQFMENLLAHRGIDEKERYAVQWFSSLKEGQKRYIETRLASVVLNRYVLPLEQLMKEEVDVKKAYRTWLTLVEIGEIREEIDTILMLFASCKCTESLKKIESAVRSMDQIASTYIHKFRTQFPSVEPPYSEMLTRVVTPDAWWGIELYYPASLPVDFPSEEEFSCPTNFQV